MAVSEIVPDPLSGGVNYSGSKKEIEMSEETVNLNITAKTLRREAERMLKRIEEQK